MLRSVLLSCLLCLAGCSSAGPLPPPQSLPAEPTAEAPRLVMLGDSLTAGLGVPAEQALPALLERRLKQDGFDWKVINAGVSGETSSGARGRVEWIARLRPRLVVVETGANDGLRGLDPALTEQNLEALVSDLQTRSVGVVLVEMRAPLNLGADYTRKFDPIYQRVARKRKVRLIPFLLQGVAARPAFNLSDGMHPNARGYAAICARVAPLIEAELRARPQ